MHRRFQIAMCVRWQEPWVGGKNISCFISRILESSFFEPREVLYKELRQSIKVVFI